MKKNLFEMGADFGDAWHSDNKEKSNPINATKIKEPSKHQLHFAKEKRRGKVVTIVKPFYLSTHDLQTLAKTLKKRLGTGGTIKDNHLEFQGDIPEKIRQTLESMGYGFKT